MSMNQANMPQFSIDNNQINNNQMLMYNMMNNQILMNNMMNNPMGFNNMMNNQMGFNNMMNNQKPNNNKNQPNKILQMQNQNINSNKIETNKEPIKLPKKRNKKKKEIPLILQKNANQTIESITFQVEKGLKPTDKLLYNNNINYIFNNLFQKRKKELNRKVEKVNQFMLIEMNP